MTFECVCVLEGGGGEKKNTLALGVDLGRNSGVGNPHIVVLASCSVTPMADYYPASSRDATFRAFFFRPRAGPECLPCHFTARASLATLAMPSAASVWTTTGRMLTWMGHGPFADMITVVTKAASGRPVMRVYHIWLDGVHYMIDLNEIFKDKDLPPRFQIRFFAEGGPTVDSVRIEPHDCPDEEKRLSTFAAVEYRESEPPSSSSSSSATSSTTVPSSSSPPRVSGGPGFAYCFGGLAGAVREDVQLGVERSLNVPSIPADRAPSRRHHHHELSSPYHRSSSYYDRRSRT